MFYTSTRNKNIKVTASQAIAQGISEEGGLFVPCELPQFSLDKIASMVDMPYTERAKTVLKDFLTDFSEEELDYCVNGAYAAEKFSSSKIAPTVNVAGNKNILELWHGPTCAFKDMALQLLPYLMTVSAKKTATAKLSLFLSQLQAIQARLLLKVSRMLTTREFLYSILLTVFLRCRNFK